ncbi:hypothetical protein IC582_003298 [Cucumis melo]
MVRHMAGLLVLSLGLSLVTRTSPLLRNDECYILSGSGSIRASMPEITIFNLRGTKVSLF